MGVYKWANGESYDGQWADGMKEGNGIWKGMKGNSYVG
jgi:hypothetical protein